MFLEKQEHIYCLFNAIGLVNNLKSQSKPVLADAAVIDPIDHQPSDDQHHPCLWGVLT